MIRSDGSVRSQNNPVWQNRAQPRDYGMYQAVVVSKKIPNLNLSSTTNAELTYNVRILGGERDGQMIFDCRVSRTMGGHQNYSDTTLKPSEDPTNLPIGSQFNFTQFVGKETGDYVYLQFINGDPSLPIIVGFAKHPQDPNSEVPDLPLSLGQQKIQKFNGVKSTIDPSGNYKWSKGLGTYVPVGPNLDVDQLGTPSTLINEYSPVPGSEELFSFNVDGLVLGVPVQTATFSTLTGMALSVDILTDSITFSTATQTAIEVDGISGSINLGNVVGTAIAIDGVQDSIGMTTAVGAAITVSGLTDSIGISTLAGAGISVDGLTDQISFDTLSGSKIQISPLNGIVKVATGSGLAVTATGASLTDPTGAGFRVENGQIAMGNAAVELLSILGEAFQALSTQTAPGFGAPTSTVATFLQLYAKLTLITGSL